MSSHKVCQNSLTTHYIALSPLSNAVQIYNNRIFRRSSVHRCSLANIDQSIAFELKKQCSKNVFCRQTHLRNEAFPKFIQASFRTDGPEVSVPAEPLQPEATLSRTKLRSKPLKNLSVARLIVLQADQAVPESDALMELCGGGVKKENLQGVDLCPKAKSLWWTRVVAIVQASVNKAKADTEETLRHGVKAPRGVTTTALIEQPAGEEERQELQAELFPGRFSAGRAGGKVEFHLTHRRPAVFSSHINLFFLKNSLRCR